MARPLQDAAPGPSASSNPVLAPSSHSPLWVAFEAASDMVALFGVETGPAFRILALNQACRAGVETLPGDVAVVDLIGKTLDEIMELPAIPPGVGQHVLRGLGATFETLRIVEIQEVVQTTQGARNLESRFIPVVDASQRCQHIVFTSRDVTARVQSLDLLLQSEAKFAGAFRASPAPMSIASLEDGRFIDVNDACCRLWGYSREEFIGKNAIDLRLWHEPMDRQAFFEQFDASGSVRDLEIVVRTRYDDRRIVRFSAERVEVQGEPCMVAAIHDVTAIREAESIQRQVEAQLRQSQKLEALGTLAGGIAHDFNNILTVIVGNTELISMDAETPHAIRGYVEALREASDRARTLVRQILSFSRRRDRERQIFDVRKVATDASSLLGSGLPSTLTIERSVPAEPVLVNADPHQIQQVLVNLAMNAAHAVGSKPGTLTIAVDVVSTDEPLLTTAPQLGPGSYARITVEDTGVGMDEDTLQRIFEPFFTTKQPGEGTGLGLAVVHGIVSEHQGALSVETRPGVGTRVVVYLPLHAGPPSAELDAPERQVPRGRGERIMVVDDEAMVGQACARLLDRIGYVTEVFGGGKDALARFEQAPDAFALLVTDLAMPNMTGVELAKAILAKRPGMPVLLLTGYSAGLSEADAVRSGVRRVIQKPVTVDVLADAVREALDG